MVKATELLVSIIMGVLMTMSILSSSAPPVAKPGCKSQCGNVSIPFPFGIGSSDCFLDKWFEIVCIHNSTAPPTPFLKNTNLEVLNISFDDADTYYKNFQGVQVKSPIVFFNCTNKETPILKNLSGSPFYYSTANTFFALSCGVPAKLETTSGNYQRTQTGCTSICSTDKSNISCDGINCCRTSLPLTADVSKTFEISFDNSASTAADQECKFAFIVDVSWAYSYKNTTATTMRFSNMDYVPVILSWDFNYTYFDLYKKNMLPREIQSFYCEDYYDTSSNITYSSQRPAGCHCNSGFRGNPYLIDGCKDINECDEKIRPCDNGGICMNTYGGYHCSFRRKFIFIGIGSALGALVLLFGTLGAYKFIKKRREVKRRKKFFKRNGGLLLEKEISSRDNNVEKTKLFNSNELEKATDHFSFDRILGQGGQGTVYKGMLEDGKIVAVKKSKIIDEAKLSEFINEVVILSQINHRNVVNLLGCCLETEVPLLVYEFIPNGTLSDYIHERNEEFPFTWKMRLRIATEGAGALSYLHSAASFPIYHRDIKSTNILLDEKYRAKVADFGTSRTISLEQTHLTTLVYGTFGYLDPEYFQSSQFTDKSDVYSFGVVLVELLTGQKAISMTRSEEGRSLATYFIMTMEEDGLFDILDAQVLKDAPKEEIIIVADLAQRCLHLNGRNRPSMKEVAIELEGIQRPDRVSKVQQNYEEPEYVRTELVKPWDVSTSFGSALDDTATHSS